MQVQSLGWEDALEEGMATDSSIRAWEIPWTEEPGRLQSKGGEMSLGAWDASSQRFSSGLGCALPWTRPWGLGGS